MKDDDRELIALVAKGDQNAFKQLVETYQGPVLSTIYRFVGDASATDDLAQEVFIKVWEKAKTFKGISRFSTWLYRIVVNHCLNYRKKRGRERTRELDESLPDTSPGVEERYEGKRRTEHLRKVMDELPPRQRMALILFKFEGYTCKEVAKIMGVTFPAAQSLVFRGIDNLRKKLL